MNIHHEPLIRLRRGRPPAAGSVANLSLRLVAQGRLCGVAAAGAVDARAWMGRGRCQVEAADGGAVAEVWKCRAEEELLPKLGAAASQVASHQIFVHRFQINRRKDGPP